MSALGQKQTFAAQNVMSALTPKADMCSATRDVRFVRIADIRRFKPGPTPRQFPAFRLCLGGKVPGLPASVWLC
jgi:hypothetical protein